MKKISSFILVLAIGSTIFASCQKCSTCNYTYRIDGVDTTVVFAQTCGNAKEIQRYKDDVTAKAARYGSNTVDCKDE